MPVDESKISAFIKGAWDETLNKSEDYKPTGDPRRDNAARSRMWVDSMGEAFLKHYEGKNQRVFWRRNGKNWKGFRLKELLFDIAVCEIKRVSSIVKEERLPFVTNCYWQVESELDNKNSREITKDFSKLVMGHSDNKLFVSSYIDRYREAAETLFSSMASHCQGNLYLCFIPHPSDWDAALDGPKPELLKWVAGGWKAL